MLDARVSWTTSTTSSKQKNDHSGSKNSTNTTTTPRKERITCLDFNHDGTEVAVAIAVEVADADADANNSTIGNTNHRRHAISIYRCSDGKLLHHLTRGHKGMIYTLSYSKPSTSPCPGAAAQTLLLASGGGDNDRTTIVWDTNYIAGDANANSHSNSNGSADANSSQGGSKKNSHNNNNNHNHSHNHNHQTRTIKGMVKFAHGSSVQRVLFHPSVPNLLASVSRTDYAFWSPSDTTVKKYSLFLHNKATTAMTTTTTTTKTPSIHGSSHGIDSSPHIIRAATWSTSNTTAHATSTSTTTTTSSNMGVPILVLGLQSGDIHCRDIRGQCIYSYSAAAHDARTIMSTTTTTTTMRGNGGAMISPTIRRGRHAPIMDLGWFVDDEYTNGIRGSPSAAAAAAGSMMTSSSNGISSNNNNHSAANATMDGGCGGGGILAVASWDRMFSLYHIRMNDAKDENGRGDSDHNHDHNNDNDNDNDNDVTSRGAKLIVEHKLDYYPCTISSFTSHDGNESFIFVGGSRMGIDVFNIKGIHIMTLTLRHQQQSSRLLPSGRGHGGGIRVQHKGDGGGGGGGGGKDGDDDDHDTLLEGIWCIRSTTGGGYEHGNAHDRHTGGNNNHPHDDRNKTNVACVNQFGTLTMLHVTRDGMSSDYYCCQYQCRWGDFVAYRRHGTDVIIRPIRVIRDTRNTTEQEVTTTISFLVTVRHVAMADGFLAVVTSDRMTHVYQKIISSSSSSTSPSTPSLHGSAEKSQRCWWKLMYKWKWISREDDEHQSSFETIMLLPSSSCLRIVTISGKRVTLQKIALGKDDNNDYQRSSEMNIYSGDSLFDAIGLMSSSSFSSTSTAVDIAQEWYLPEVASSACVFCNVADNESVLVGLVDGRVMRVTLEDNNHPFLAEMFQLLGNNHDADGDDAAGKIDEGPPHRSTGSKIYSLCTNTSTSTASKSTKSNKLCRYVGVRDGMDQLYMYDVMSGSFVRGQEEPIATECRDELMFHDSVESLYCCRTNSCKSSNRSSRGNGNVIVGYGGVTMMNVECRGGSSSIIVGFEGSDIVTLYGETLYRTRINVASMAEQKIREGDYTAALEIAKLGVGDLVWLYLWNQSILSLKFDIASKCLVSVSRLEMTRRLWLLQEEQENRMMSSSLMQQQVSKDEVVHHLQPNDKSHDLIASAEIDILEGRFKQAGETFCNLGLREKAIALYVTMKMFHDAKALVAPMMRTTTMKSRRHHTGDDDDDDEKGTKSTTRRNSILAKEAEWEENMCRWKDASHLHFECGNRVKAIEITGERKYEGWVDCIVEYARKIPPTTIENKDALELCCKYLSSEEGNENDIKNILIKIGDDSKLMALYIKMKAWIDVSKLFEEKSKSRKKRQYDGDDVEDDDNTSSLFDHTLLLPYADWLAAQEEDGKLPLALEVNRTARRRDRNMSLLSFLIKDALSQGCYGKVSSLYLMVAEEEKEEEEEQTMRATASSSRDTIGVWNKKTTNARCSEMHRLAMIYHAWDKVSEYASISLSGGVGGGGSLVTTNTTIPQSHTVLQSCAYLLNMLSPNNNINIIPEGISLPLLLETFIHIAKSLNANHSARVAYERLLLLGHNQQQEQEQTGGKKIVALEDTLLDLEALPDDGDEEDLHPVCFRCGSTNDLLRKRGGNDNDKKGDDSCQVCMHPFVRCTTTFDVLPLVEFVPISPLDRNDVLRLVNGDCSSTNKGNGPPVGHVHGNGRGRDDLFHEAINVALTQSTAGGSYSPVEVDEEILQKLRTSDIHIMEDAVGTGATKYYKNMIPDIGIIACEKCGKFFHDVEYEFGFLRDGWCSYCRRPPPNY